MIYAIIGRDVEGSLSLRKQARPQHVERLKALQEQGRLVIAGPFPAADAPDMLEAGYTGSLILAEFASLEEAREWADTDPYLTAGVYKEVQVMPFIQALP